MELRLTDLPRYLSDEAEAWKLLERLRWRGTPVCPHCGVVSDHHYFISAKSGERVTAKGTVTYRRLWRCREKGCRKQFSVLVGTIFESSKVPVSKWLLAIWMMNAGKNGVSALELQRQLRISYQTAWFMAHRLREAMRREPLSSLLAGTIVADETYVGGKPKNMHRRQFEWTDDGRRIPYKDKTPVVSLVHKESGEVRSQVVTSVNAENLRNIMETHVDMPASVLHTDRAHIYRHLGWEFQEHQAVNHAMSEYVRGNVSTNLAESYFAQFKRSLNGTYHSVSERHLGRYVGEFDFRWNTRKMTDSERIEKMIGNVVGRRLTYRPLTGDR